MCDLIIHLFIVLTGFIRGIGKARRCRCDIWFTENRYVKKHDSLCCRASLYQKVSDLCIPK